MKPSTYSYVCTHPTSVEICLLLCVSHLGCELLESKDHALFLIFISLLQGHIYYVLDRQGMWYVRQREQHEQDHRGMLNACSGCRTIPV